MKTTGLWLLCLLLSVPVYAQTKTADVWATSYALEAQGLYGQSAEALEPMLKDAETLEFAWLRVAWLQYLSLNYNDAIDAYKNALNANKGSFDAMLGISLPLMAQQRWLEAIQYLHKVTNLSPWNYTANIRILASLEGLKKWSDMKQLAEMVSARYPSEVMPLIYLARALNQLGDKANAKWAYQQVLMRSPTNLEALIFNS